MCLSTSFSMCTGILVVPCLIGALPPVCVLCFIISVLLKSLADLNRKNNRITPLLFSDDRIQLDISNKSTKKSGNSSVVLTFSQAISDLQHLNWFQLGNKCSFAQKLYFIVNVSLELFVISYLSTSALLVPSNCRHGSTVSMLVDKPCASIFVKC